MRESRAWRAARRLPKGKERTAAHRDLNKRFGFREYDLYPFIQTMRRSFVGEHLDAHTCMAIAARAFAVCERWAVGSGGRPHYRRKGEFRSCEGRGFRSSLHWTGKALAWGKGFVVSAEMDEGDPVIAHALTHRVVYARVVRMDIRGRERWFAQLVCEGRPYRKPEKQPGTGVVGLDVGPSTIAIVSDRTAVLERFCDELELTHNTVARLQRKLSRQTRINNPDCYNPNGTTKRGARLRWTVGMRRTRRVIAELSRRERERRRNLHGHLAGRVLKLGNDVRTEAISYKGFQRTFGKSVLHRAPGGFLARLRAEAAKWGATVTEFPTRTTMLSRTCVCGQIRKKSLSERLHECACGCTVQRDVLSALLARHVTPQNRLDTPAALRDWKGRCAALAAVSGLSNGATGGGASASRAHPARGRAPSRPTVDLTRASAGDAVAPSKEGEARAPEKRGDGRACTRMAFDDRMAPAKPERSGAVGDDGPPLAPRPATSSRKQARPPNRQAEFW
jgi:hypothetical protein